MSHPMDEQALLYCSCGEWHYKNAYVLPCSQWSATDRALIYLGREPSSALAVGEYVFRDRRKGRIASGCGGGDYAAQMLLGRMRKAGLVGHVHRTDGGCTIWKLTKKGHELRDRVPS